MVIWLPVIFCSGPGRPAPGSSVIAEHIDLAEVKHVGRTMGEASLIWKGGETPFRFNTQFRF
jgi:hypothetical protein